MNLVKAFFQLIRWPNLVFIALTQLLFYYCVFPVSVFLPLSSHISFFLLLLASLFIAAAGYIINDYFDLKIDAINKPDKVIVGKSIKRRWAIVWHLTLSSLGILLSLYIGYVTQSFIIVLGNIAAVAALWFYSTSFKKRLLIGNLIISALSAWVILVIYIFSIANFFQEEVSLSTILHEKYFYAALFFAFFAFVVTLIREVVKDLEDMEGDRAYGCTTMPLAWGVPASKVFIGVWSVVCVLALAFAAFYFYNIGMWWVGLYLIATTIIPFVFFIKLLYQGNEVAVYHKLSRFAKIIMLAGILSMLFFRLPFLQNMI